MAYRLGDGTAKMFGKLTLNPIAHFHPVGGWMLIISTLLFGIPLGFAATPVNPSNLRGRHGEAYVAAAGPAVELPARGDLRDPASALHRVRRDVGLPARLATTLFIIVFYDILLGLFNLIPVLAARRRHDPAELPCPYRTAVRRSGRSSRSTGLFIADRRSSWLRGSLSCEPRHADAIYGVLVG